MFLTFFIHHTNFAQSNLELYFGLLLQFCLDSTIRLMNKRKGNEEEKKFAVWKLCRHLGFCARFVSL